MKIFESVLWSKVAAELQPEVVLVYWKEDYNNNKNISLICPVTEISSLTIHKTFLKPEHHFYCKWKLLKDVSPRITLTQPNQKSKVMCVLLPLHLQIFRCMKWLKAWDKHISLRNILGLLKHTLRSFFYPTSLIYVQQICCYKNRDRYHPSHLKKLSI